MTYLPRPRSQAHPQACRRRNSAAATALLLPPVFFLATLARVAYGQSGGDFPDATFRPTRGVYVPDGARAGEADATAVELNPGQLPLITAGTTTLVGNLWRAEAAMPGRGAALFLAAPVWGGGGVGLGVHGIAASGGGAVPGHGKFQLGYGVGGRRFGIGASWAHLFGGRVGGTDTFDAGVGWRPFGWVAGALVLEDFARPRLSAAADRLSRRWVSELALRPTGTDRLELSAAVLHVGGAPWSRVGTRLRLAARPGTAWRLFAEVELAPRRSDVLSSAFDSGTDWRTTVGFALDFDHGALLLAARRSFTPSGAGGENWGASAAWRSSTERNSSSTSSGRVARVKMEGTDSDREFLNLALLLRHAARDTTTAALLLNVQGTELGFGRIEELRDLIAEARGRGKKVIAYVTNASMRDTYLASACDRVVMHPAGGMTFAGLAHAVTFYKGAMDRLGVNVDLVRIAEFKGAMEPYVMTSQSDPVRQNRNALLDDVHARILSGIAAGRASALAGSGLSPKPSLALDVARLDELISVGTFTPDEAQRAGLVDAVRDDHEIEQYLRDFLGLGAIDVLDSDPAPLRSPRWSRSRVAVILLDGTISDGPSHHFPLGLGDVAGADTLVDALEECRRDPDIRAVVLRVNSPGGSAFSSDVIARAVSRVRAAGKPVVASMADVAASGGYYVSAPADVIFAEPSTTTGSIGIFGFKLDVARLLSMLSINVEVVRRGPHADQQAPYRPWTADERAMTERKIRHLYDLFVATVATGRKSRGVTPARVDEVGRGHVWTGAQARPLGLVDDFGGVIAAIDRAAALGAVPLTYRETPDLVILPRPNSTVLQRILGLPQANADGAPSPFPPSSLAEPVKSALRLAAPYLLGPGEGIDARLPFDLQIR